MTRGAHGIFSLLLTVFSSRTTGRQGRVSVAGVAVASPPERAGRRAGRLRHSTPRSEVTAVLLEVAHSVSFPVSFFLAMESRGDSAAVAAIVCRLGKAGRRAHQLRHPTPRPWVAAGRAGTAHSAVAIEQATATEVVQGPRRRGIPG